MEGTLSLQDFPRWIRSRRSGWSKSLLTLAALFAVAGLARVAPVWATPSLGLVGQTLAFGVAEDGISGHMQVNTNPSGTVSPWQLQLQAQRDTDYHVLRLVLSPGGHSGWHSHPGLLIGAVTSAKWISTTRIARSVRFSPIRCTRRTTRSMPSSTVDKRTWSCTSRFW